MRHNPQSGWPLVLTLLLVVSGGLAPARGEAVDPARLFPRDTLVYLGWSGSEQIAPAAGPTALGKTLAEPSVQRFMDELATAVDLLIGRAAAEEDAAATYRAAKQLAEILWRRPAALGLIDFGLTEQGPSLKVALVADVGADQGRVTAAVTSLFETAGLPPSVTETVAGHAMKRLALPLPGGVYYGVARGHFILAVGKETVETIVGRLSDDTGSLAGDGPLVTARKKIGGTTETRAFTVFANTKALLEHVQPLLTMLFGRGDPQASGMFQAAVPGLGLDSLESACWEMHLRDGGCVHGLYFATATPRTGLLALAGGSPITEADLAVIPKQPGWATAMNFNPGEAYRQIRSILAGLGPDIDAGVGRWIGRLEAELGLRLDRDFLDLIGDTFVLFDAPDNGGILFTGATLVVEVQEGDRLQKGLRAIVQGIARLAGRESVDIASTEHRNHRIEFINVVGVPMPFAPAWALHGDRLIVALFPQMVAFTLDRLLDGNPQTDSILANADFVRARRVLGPLGTSVSYVDTKAGVEQLYTILLPLAQMGAAMIQAEGANIDISAMPSRRALTQHLFAKVSTVRTDAQGILWQTYGPLPVSATPTSGAAMAAPLAISVMLPALARARELAKRTVCMSNMKGIGNSCHIYANEHDGRFPPDLQTLIDEGAVSEGMLRCPSAGNNQIAYVYVAGQGATSNGRNVVLYEHRDNHAGEGINVVFADSRAEWMSLVEFETALAATKRRLGSD